MVGDSQLINLYLGPKSSYCGVFSDLPNSLYVDFLSNFVSHQDSNVEADDSVLWDGKVDHIDASQPSQSHINPYNPNPELSWSEISDISNRNSVKLLHVNNFSSYHSGVNMFKEGEYGEVFEDKVRFLIEKCDIFGGFMSVYDTSTGYSGLLSSLLNLFDDVYGRKAKITFGVCDAEPPSIFELEALTDTSVCSYLKWDDMTPRKGLLNKDSDYHKGAMMSMFLSSVSQITKRGCHVKELASFLAPLSRNIFMSYLGVPYDDPTDRNMSNLFSAKYFKKNVTPLSYFSSKQVSIPLHHSYISCCGLEHATNNHQFFSSLSGLQSEVFSSSMRYCYNPQPAQLGEYFPQFFGDLILSNGRFRLPQQKVRSTPVSELPVISLLQNNTDPIQLINKVASKEIKVNKSTDLQAAGVLDDDIKDIEQKLNELADNYTFE